MYTRITWAVLKAILTPWPQEDSELAGGSVLRSTHCCTSVSYGRLLTLQACAESQGAWRRSQLQ